MVSLISVEKIFPIFLKSYSNTPMYEQIRKIEIDEIPKSISEKQFLAYGRDLARRYPDRGYEVKRLKVLGVEYLVLKKKKFDRYYVPIYYCLQDGWLYVPRSYVKRNRRRVGRVLIATLGSLGFKFKYTVVEG